MRNIVFLLLMIYVTFYSAIRANEIIIPVVKSPVIVLNESNFIPITEEFSQSLLDDFQEMIMTTDEKELTLYFESPGGSVFAVARMSSILRNSNIKTICVARFAASAAFSLFQSCTERYILADGIVMQHNWSGGFQDEGPRIKSLLAVIDSITETHTVHEATRMGIELNAYKALLSNNFWMDANMAIKNHAVDGIVEKISCEPKLVKNIVKKQATIMSLFGPITSTVYKSQCPLIHKEYPAPKASSDLNYVETRQHVMTDLDKLFTHTITPKLKAILHETVK